MAFRVVLDTNVLLPAPLRDMLLRLAEAELYVPKWSNRILEELADNLVESGRTDAERAVRVTTTMAEAFPEALAPDSLVSTLEPAMVNDPKDRHVLAAAVGVGAQAIVTRNLGDFPPEACEPLGIEILSPDNFLIDLYRLDPSAPLRALSDQAAALTRPPLTPHQVLDYIALDAPGFAALVGETLSLLGEKAPHAAKR
jgi:predicted nucleic acid-binding protein